jgi:SNF2 family DNA or RNA helicase
MTNKIYTYNNKIYVTFKFDVDIVTKVRSIDGRHWNAKDKVWEFPIENLEEVVTTLEPYNFLISNDLRATISKQKDEETRISKIKSNPDAPYTGNLPLHDYQRKGAMFLKSLPYSLLGDVPGLGKTIQVLAATENDPHILIFTMNSLKYNMASEIEKWFPGSSVLVITGNKKLRSEQWELHAKNNKYVVANYELLFYDIDLIKKHPWHTIICDEATKISNPENKTSRNLKLLKSEKRIALTGTPVSNSPIDVYGIFDFMIPKYLGTFYQFKEKYCILDPRFHNVIGYKNIDELSNKVERFMLRRRKEEVFKELPPKIVEDVIFSLSGKELELYDAIKKQIIDEIHKLSDMNTNNLNIIPVKMLRLKQCTDHVRLITDSMLGESSKFQALESLLEPIVASGGKVIIFTQFAEMLHIMDQQLKKKYKVFTIYGEVKPIDRLLKTKEFNDYDGPAIMCMTEAGAYGLNMKSASYIIHYDLPWSVAKVEQREGRADRSADKRIGGELPVTIYNLIAKDTIDEYVAKVLLRKNKVAVDINQDNVRLLDQGLTQDDIDEILRL